MYLHINEVLDQHTFTEDETTVSNGAKETNQDAQVMPSTASTYTPAIEKQSTISTEVAVVANVKGIEMVLVMTRKPLTALDQAYLSFTCPSKLIYASTDGGKMNGHLFATCVVRLLREQFLNRCKRDGSCSKFNVTEEQLQRAPLLLVVDAPSTHRTAEVQEMAGKKSFNYPSNNASYLDHSTTQRYCGWSSSPHLHVGPGNG